MRQLLLASVILFIFSLSILIIQTSCQKSIAWDSQVTNQLNKLVFRTSNGKLWMCNYDGTNITQLLVNLPSQYRVSWMSESNFILSPDGQKAFYNVGVINSPIGEPFKICSSDISGNNFTVVVLGNAQLLEPVLIGVY